MKIVVVGMCYVGLLNSMLLAQDNKVIGVDISILWELMSLVKLGKSQWEYLVI